MKYTYVWNFVQKLLIFNGLILKSKKNPKKTLPK